MNSIERFSGLVGSIYDCVAEPQRWSGVLQQLCDDFDGPITTLAVLDTKRRSARFGACGGDPEIYTPLVTTYAADMPFYHVIPKMEIDVPINLDTLFGLAGPNARQTFFESRLGQEWVIPFDIADGICLSLLKHDEHIGTLVVTTTRERRPVTDGDLADMAILAPHLRRAVTIGDLFETGQREAQLFRDVVDHFDSAVLVVTADCRLLYANPAAEQLMRDGVVVTLQQGRLQFPDNHASSAISSSIAKGERSEIAMGATGIGVPLARATRPAVAHILPLRRRSAGAQLHDDRATAAIFIAAAGKTTVSAMDAIASLYGLTAAEKRVATQVASGLSRAEIATASGVGDGTVKSQLGAIYDKTGTGSQRELDLLIRELTPPVKAVDDERGLNK